jgi:hypothetical protein
MYTYICKSLPIHTPLNPIYVSKYLYTHTHTHTHTHVRVCVCVTCVCVCVCVCVLCVCGRTLPSPSISTPVAFSSLLNTSRGATSEAAARKLDFLPQLGFLFWAFRRLSCRACSQCVISSYIVSHHLFKAPVLPRLQPAARVYARMRISMYVCMYVVCVCVCVYLEPAAHDVGAGGDEVPPNQHHL